ncbi:HNH endonuclease [Allorhizobium undicola]|uniref:HNH endonuclease n=1 Tax=Allorhizobium undicola TaxID=78527 RepID=UPI003D32A7BD
MAGRKEQKRQADRWRGSASERGYNHRWNKARSTFLASHPLCIGCLAEGRTEAAAVVDHVDPHHGDPDKFWNTSMWQPCCRWHHDSVKQRLELLYAAGRLTINDLWLNSKAALDLAAGMRCDEAKSANPTPPPKSPTPPAS